jgi:hypothetical protein
MSTKAFGVDQEADVSFASPVPQHRNVVTSTDTTSAIVENITGIAGQLVKAGLAGASQDRIGTAAQTLQGELQGLLGKNKSRTERDEYLTNRLGEMMDNGKIRPRDRHAVLSQISRRATEQRHIGGRNVMVATDSKEILGQTPEGKAAAVIIKQAEEVNITFPTGTASWGNFLSKAGDSYNAKVINSASKLSSLLNNLQVEAHTSPATNVDQMKADVKARKGEFQSAIMGLLSDIMNPDVARAIGKADGTITANAPRLVVQDIFSDLRMHLKSQPEVLRTLGMDLNDLEVMALTARQHATEFGTNSQSQGSFQAAQLVQDKQALQLKLRLTRNDIDVWRELPEHIKKASSRAGFLDKYLSISTNLATLMNEPTLVRVLAQPFFRPELNHRVKTEISNVTQAIAAQDAIVGRALIRDLPKVIGTRSFWFAEGFPELLGKAEDVLKVSDPDDVGVKALKAAIDRAKKSVPSFNKLFSGEG